VNQGTRLGGVATDGTKIGGSVVRLFLELEVLVHIGCSKKTMRSCGSSVANDRVIRRNAGMKWLNCFLRSFLQSSLVQHQFCAVIIWWIALEPREKGDLRGWD
jgi:hypothetical protein